MMILAALLLLAQTTTADCTVKGLNLSTAALSETDAKTLAKAHYAPAQYFIRSTTFGNNRYTFKEIGYLDYLFGFTTKPIVRVMGQDETGSWRKAWNQMLINECKAKHEPVPVRF